MEVSAKGGRGWGEGQQDEGGMWVGRKKGGRWVGVGRSFPKKKLGVKGGPKKIDKKTELGEKKEQKKNIYTDQVN